MRQGSRGIAFAGGESFAIQGLPTALVPLPHFFYVCFNKHAHLPLWVLIPSIPNCKVVENSCKWTKESRCWRTTLTSTRAEQPHTAHWWQTLTIIDIHLSTLYMTACILLNMHNWLLAITEEPTRHSCFGSRGCCSLPPWSLHTQSILAVAGCSLTFLRSTWPYRCRDKACRLD